MPEAGYARTKALPSAWGKSLEGEDHPRYLYYTIEEKQRRLELRELIRNSRLILY